MVSGASGVASGAAATSGMETQSSAASAATSLDANSRQAIPPTNAGWAAKISAFSARAPNSERPNRSVEARIQAAIIGG